MNFKKILLIAHITFIEGIRNRVLMGLILMALFSSSVSLVLVPIFAFDQAKVLVDLSLAFMQLAGLAVIFFMAISLVAQDIYNRSACLIIGRPVSRSEYVLGKFAGLALILLLSMAILGVISLGLAFLFFHYAETVAMPRNFSWSVLLLVFAFSYLSHLVVMAVAFCLSVLTTNVYLSMLCTFGVYFLGQSMETVVRVVATREFVQLDNTYTLLLKIISWVLPNLRAFDFKIYLAYGLPLSASEVLWTLLYGLSYLVILLYFSMISFSAKDV